MGRGVAGTNSEDSGSAPQVSQPGAFGTPERAADVQWLSVERVDAPRRHVTRIAYMRLEDAGDLERACARLQGLATADTPFGVLFLVADATCLDREAQRFATAIRRLPGRRARFGAWCRAIAYVFDPPRYRFAARAHLRAAPFVFGTRVLYDHGMNES